ncbi:MAG: hypothetical protein LBF16_00915 [Pseudomonadales bacterium]|jgi:hypothetical protein|nr:hypothetical protein [Pseudomonadales bacterium]
MKIKNAIAAITGGWTSRYHTALILLLCLAIPFSANAQNIIGASVEPLGSDRREAETVPIEFAAVRDIRIEQRKLANQAGISIREIEENGRSGSIIEGVPPELRDIQIFDEKQLASIIIPDIYKYYGLTGTETLKFLRKMNAMGSMRYTFQEYINGIEVPSYCSVDVDPKSGKVTHVGGGLNIDREYDTEPVISEQEAFDLVVEYIINREKQKGPNNNTDNRANIKSQVIYVMWPGEKGLQPTWLFLVPLKNPFTIEAAFEQFIVYPDGSVMDGTMSVAAL